MSPIFPTTWFQMPWDGGEVTSLHEAVIGPNNCVKLSNTEYGVRGSRKKRDGIDFGWDSGTSGSAKILRILDYWFGSSSTTHRLVAVHDDKKLHSYQTDGTKSSDLFDGSSWSTTPTLCTLCTFNDVAIIAVDGSSNAVKQWTGTGSAFNLGKTKEVSSVDTIGDTAGSLSGDYFDLEDSLGTARVWYDVDNGSTPPATPAGGRLIEVDIATGDSANTVATNTKTALDADGKFTTSRTNNELTITCIQRGARTDVSAGTSGFTVAVDTQGADAPASSIVGVHAGRLWMNDKTRKDRLHYSPVSDHETWEGEGDSGAIDIGLNDGDPEGITAFWSFKGVLFVAKKNSLFRIDGFHPEEFRVTKISSGLGCVGPNAWAYVDERDVVFVSDRGIHSLAAVEQFGDFAAQFLSALIQRTFNESFDKSRLKYSQLAYIPNLNSIACTFTDTDISSTTSNTIRLYNLEKKAWYRWEKGLLTSCESIVTVTDSDQKRLYIGGNTSRIAKTAMGLNYDTSESDVSTAIPFEIETGIIYPDNDPINEKVFLSFIKIYSPFDGSEVTASLKIDNYPRQSLSFTDSIGAGSLDDDFILDVSELASEPVLAPYSRTLDGIGRGVKLTLTQSGVEESAEINGIGFEYVPCGPRPEVIV